MPFQIGQIVRPKCYPERQFTIVSVHDDWVLCRWFEGGSSQEASFAVDDLELVPQQKTE
ncbi:hypothetical protein [Microvirga rosea]|uniref:hypothetical protein n=1 Tax=Microvirga rosea TaxID=2715425 RepID=UPI001D0A150C|nr:hypothetical protein [Microvirga rosea]MCB8820091.1 hypothetical protein [Microvirga rosea]